MATPKNFTFKTNKPTGKFAWTDNPNHYIKLEGKQIGSIDHETPHKIKLMVFKKDINEDGNPNCSWKWISLKHQSSSLDDAKKYLNDNFDAIIKQFSLRKSDN